MRPRRQIRRAATLLALIVSLSVAATASAGPSAVVTDCNAHSALTHQYTVAQLRTALSTMPPTVKEYTNCYDVINRALLAQIGSPGGGSAGKSSGGSFLPVWLIVLLVLLVIGGGGYALIASRRQGATTSDGGPDGPGHRT